MSLQIIGLGPARPEHITLEAMTALQKAVKEGHHIYGLAHARSMVQQIIPHAQLKSLDYLYQLPDIDRPRAYRDLAQMMIRKAFTDGLKVLYLVAGSPLYYNDAVLLIRQLSAQQGHSLRLIHGMSFVDLVLDRVYWSGHHGLQLYSAWNIAFDGVQLTPHAPALLCQLGEFSRGADALNTDKSTHMLQHLRDKLLKAFPPNHQVTILYSSGKPDYRSLSKSLPLSSLDSDTVPVYSNLWIPSIDDPSEGEAHHG